MWTLRRGLAIGLMMSVAACSARYATAPDGLPVGSPDVTYYGPGAAIGGTRIDSPPPAVPPPANPPAP